MDSAHLSKTVAFSSRTLRDNLMRIGAGTVIVGEEELKAEMKKSSIAARLALNCVGGRNTLQLAACLRDGGKLVTYGGMSKMPLQVPTGPLIFKDISLHGFWMTRWYSWASAEKRREMMDHLIKLVKENRLKAPELDLVPFDEYDTAIRRMMQGHNKQLLVMN